MNNRIYSNELFDKAIADYLRKNHCPFCYHFLIGSVITATQTYISSRDPKDIWCDKCNMKFERSDLLTKEQIRDKKIDEVLKK